MSSIDPLVPLSPGKRETGSDRGRAVRFGALVAGVLVALALASIRRRGVTPVSEGMLVVGPVFFVYSALHPPGALAVRGAWIRFGTLLGRVNSVVLLTVVYLAFLTPVAIVLRLFGRKPFGGATGGAFVPREPRDPAHFEHPY